MIFSFDLLSAEVIQRQVNLNMAQKNEVSQFPVDLVTFTEEILNRKFHFLYNAI